MTTPTNQSAAARLQSLRIIAIAFLSGVVLLGVVAVLVLGLTDYPSPLVAGGLFLLNVAAFVTAETIGYRAGPIPPGTAPERAGTLGVDALQQTTMLRLAITEAPAIISLVLAFITGSAWVYIVGAFWALLSMAWHGWPWQRVVAKLERSLQREGGPAGLSDVAAGRPTG